MEVKPPPNLMSPVIYAGGESITYPDGRIEKKGYIADAGVYTTVTFATEFPNACENVTITPLYDGALADEPHTRYALTTTGFVIVDANSPDGYYWKASGY